MILCKIGGFLANGKSDPSPINVEESWCQGKWEMFVVEQEKWEKIFDHNTLCLGKSFYPACEFDFLFKVTITEWDC